MYFRLIFLFMFLSVFSVVQSTEFSTVDIRYYENRIHVNIKDISKLDTKSYQYSFFHDSLDNKNYLYFNYAADKSHELFVSNENGQSIEYKSKYMGLRRNVPIFNAGIAIDNVNSLIVEIVYSKNVTKSKTDNFYIDLLNSPHALSFQKQFPNKYSEDKIQKANWIDSDNQYLLIETDKDAPAIIEMNSIFKYMPHLVGLDPNAIHLLHNGEQYPFYIDDSDGILNDNDRIIFLGKRAHGDTTWYDFYTKEEPFFLYYDDQIQSKKLELLELPPNANSNLESVIVEKFIPVYEQYYDGHSFDTEKVDTEGWMSKFFHPYQGKTFYSNNIFIDPFTDSLNIKLNYLAINNIDRYEETDRQYNLELRINNFTEDNIEFTGKKFGEFSVNIASERVSPGMNSIALHSMPITNQFLAGFTSVKNIEIIGRVKPFAINGNIHFKTDELDQSSNLLIPGFSSENVVIIDKLNNRIAFAQTTEKTSIKVFANKQENGTVLSTVINNDTSAFANGTGVLISYMIENNIRTRYFADPGTDAIGDLIRELPLNAMILYAFAADKPITPATKFELEELGAQDIPLTGTHIFAAVKGTEIKFEDRDVNISQINEMIDIMSNHFVADINLPKGNYELIISDVINSGKPKLSLVSDRYPSELSGDFDVIVLTHRDLFDLGQEYKEYRENFDHKIEVVDVVDIYKEYNYGRVSPFAIKDFLKDIYGKNSELKYLVILGDASWDPGKLLDFSVSNNYIPIYGFPYSDFWYGLLDEDDGEYEPELIVGRIPINNRNQFENYMDKVYTYDNISEKPWMKDFLFLSGGANGFERSSFKAFGQTTGNVLINDEPLGGSFEMIAKQDENPGSEVKGGEIRTAINSGKIWTNFLGHAAADIYDLEGWQVERLNNENRYGILTTLSCNTGDFANPQLKMPRNEAYILEPKKGFVISMGSTTTGFVSPHTLLATNMIESVVDSDLQLRNVGEILNFGKMRLTPPQSYYLYTRLHYSLLGDPLLQLRIKKQPDPFIMLDDLNIINSNDLTDQMEDVFIKAMIHNNGICTDESYEIAVIRSFENKIDSSFYYLGELCTSENLNFSLPIKDMPGEHRIEIIIDPNKISDDSKFNNNSIKFNINVLTQGLTMLEPLPYWNINANHPEFRVIDQLNEFAGEKSYKFIISDTNAVDGNIFASSINDEISIYETHIEWKPSSVLQKQTNYWFGAYYETNNGFISETLWVPFNTYSDNINQHSEWILRSSSEFNSSRLESIETFEIDNKDAFKIQNKIDEVHVISYSGNPALGETNHSYISMDVDNNTFVDGFYLRGLNLVRVPVQNNSESGIYKRFDTWGDGSTHVGDWFSDSVAIELIDYLRDSVRSDEYLIVGTCNAVWRMPLLHKLDPDVTKRGSLDTLKDVLNLFGSQLIDSVEAEYNIDKVDWKHAFGMIGRKGMPYGSIVEDINNTLDSVVINSEITRFTNKGKLVTNSFGPALLWENIEIEGFIPENGFDIEIKVVGIDPLGNEDTLKHVKNNLNISVEDIEAEKYPNLYLVLEMMRTSFEVEHTFGYEFPYISDIIANFIPLSELAVLKSTIEISKNDVLRGEEIEFNVNIKNISRRTTAKNNKLLFRIAKPDFIDEIIDIPQLAPDEVYTYSKIINTSSMEGNINLSIILNPDSDNKEIYSFNNDAHISFNVRQDSIAPEIELFVDNRSVTNGDFVQNKPTIKIRIFDNSPLPINDPSNILVFINSIFMDEQNTDLYEYAILDNGNLKGELILQPKNELEYGTDEFLPANSIRVVAFDATGNSDTLRVLVNVALNADIQNIMNYPNPFTTSTIFKWNYRAKDNSAQIIIDIYDSHGRKVNQIERQAIIGDNEIEWQALNKRGASLSSGVYFYSIRVEGIFAEPAFGNFIITN